MSWIAATSCGSPICAATSKASTKPASPASAASLLTSRAGGSLHPPRSGRAWTFSTRALNARSASRPTPPRRCCGRAASPSSGRCRTSPSACHRASNIAAIPCSSTRNSRPAITRSGAATIPALWPATAATASSSSFGSAVLFPKPPTSSHSSLMPSSTPPGCGTMKTAPAAPACIRSAAASGSPMAIEHASILLSPSRSRKSRTSTIRWASNSGAATLACFSI